MKKTGKRRNVFLVLVLAFTVCFGAAANAAGVTYLGTPPTPVLDISFESDVYPLNTDVPKSTSDAAKLSNIIIGANNTAKTVLDNGNKVMEIKHITTTASGPNAQYNFSPGAVDSRNRYTLEFKAKFAGCTAADSFSLRIRSSAGTNPINCIGIKGDGTFATPPSPAFTVDTASWLHITVVMDFGQGTNGKFSSFVNGRPVRVNEGFAAGLDINTDPTSRICQIMFDASFKAGQGDEIVYIDDIKLRPATLVQVYDGALYQNDVSSPDNTIAGLEEGTVFAAKAVINETAADFPVAVVAARYGGGILKEVKTESAGVPAMRGRFFSYPLTVGESDDTVKVFLLNGLDTLTPVLPALPDIFERR